MRTLKGILLLVMGNFCASYTQPNSSHQRSENLKILLLALPVIHLSLRTGRMVCVLTHHQQSGYWRTDILRNDRRHYHRATLLDLFWFTEPQKSYLTYSANPVYRTSTTKLNTLHVKING